MSEQDSAKPAAAPSEPPARPTPPGTTKIEASHNIGDKLPSSARLPSVPVTITPKGKK